MAVNASMADILVLKRYTWAKLTAHTYQRIYLYIVSTHTHTHSHYLSGGVFSFFMNLAGGKTITQDTMAPVLEKMKEHLITKNVAAEIAEKLCVSVAGKLDGKVIGTFTGGSMLGLILVPPHRTAAHGSPDPIPPIFSATHQLLPTPCCHDWYCRLSSPCHPLFLLTFSSPLPPPFSTPSHSLPSPLPLLPTPSSPHSLSSPLLSSPLPLLPSLLGIQSTVRASMEESLVQILSPKRRVDILRDVMVKRDNGGQPYVITFCGVNGVGKSTNLAKVRPGGPY